MSTKKGIEEAIANNNAEIKRIVEKIELLMVKKVAAEARIKTLEKELSSIKDD